jgi:hypothetical protein
MPAARAPAEAGAYDSIERTQQDVCAGFSRRELARPQMGRTHQMVASLLQPGRRNQR